jgi:aspartate kinase
MALIVQKFGGTSVGSVERIKHVAKWVIDSQLKGNKIVVVVSAMAGETNRLVALANEINPIPFSREYDMLIASGEQVSVGLVALAINSEAQKRGLKSKSQGPLARPFLGYQLGIKTDNIFSKARIQAIDSQGLFREIDQGVIPVIAGFQGVDGENNITTLGRGGSDTSAVAIAAAIKADECEIYTDVDGVYTTDPRIYKNAKKLKTISYEEMMELAGLGAKVLQIRSVELGAKYGVAIHVRSSFDPIEGTRVIPEERKNMEQIMVSGVASDPSQVKWTLQNILDDSSSTARIFTALSEQSVIVDVIVQDFSTDGTLNLGFTVSEGDFLKSKNVLEQLQKKDFPSMKLQTERNLTKISIVGVGMQHHPGVASKMFSLLAKNGIKLRLITTSEIKISVLIESVHASKAVQVLHDGFELEKVN